MIIAHALATESLWPPMVMALVLAAAILAYCRAWQHLRHRLPELTSPWRPAAFAGGMAALWLAVGSPLAGLDEALLSAHMIQHLLLSMVAAPLILLGAPMLPLLHGVPWVVMAHGIAPAVRSTSVRAIGRLLGQPAVCWSVAMVVFIGWHIPALFDLALRSERWHVVAHASFLASGILFWWPVVQPWPSRSVWPRWSMPLYLFLATLPCDALSAFLVFSDRVVYPAYLSAPRNVRLSALQDQEWAGAVMWLCVTIAYAIPAAVITTRMLSEPGRPPRRQPKLRPMPVPPGGGR
jgi:putative membrane protein